MSNTLTRATMQKRDDGSLALDLTITTGASKGDVVSVRATSAPRDAIDLVGLPCTLNVRAGEPVVEW